MKVQSDITAFDEFGEGAIRPLPDPNDKDRPWHGCGPTYKGEATPCFDGGHLFRIINQEEKKWALYNDTNAFEMHVEFTFGKESRLEALNETQITTNENGQFVATAVVYPFETVMFVSGTWNGYKSHFEGKPLSRAYLERIATSTVQAVEKAMNEVSRICSSTDPEKVLQSCMVSGVPFVDLTFPPTYKSLDCGKGVLINLPWSCPAEYLAKELTEHVALFRRPISPFSVERGDLSDSWVISAMAILSEKPESIKNVFRHPVDGTRTAKEAATGAYRALLNKDGIWTSYLVDNYLPVVGGKPRFSRSRNDPCEMWVSVMEKAYAKRNGGFANICSGDPLMAIRDITGYPTSRLDSAFDEAKTHPDKSDGFFTRLLMLCRAGHTVLFSTPGNGNERTDASEHKEKGIAIGYALPVLSVEHIKGYGLFCLRNPWSNGAQWKGNWSPSSPLWEQNPEVAAECPNHDGSDGSLWMDWTDVKKHFIGCGVVFNFPSYYDYRVPGTFTKVAPSVCLEVSVTSPLTCALILSQPDHRGTDKETVDYDPIMLNVAYSKENNDQFTVAANTSADADAPTDRYVFLLGRDVSMVYEFVPENSPYLIVPRRMEDGSGAEEVLPFTLGLLSPEPIKEGGPIKVLFKSLPGSNELFDNYPRFAYDAESATATYQVKHRDSRVETLTGCQIE
ncbi:calpain-like cysteine peptidase [Trypanosoma grayi]|uniref:calpain-like cysteine peptidase n=1 Tax=Trypanosoma grayi TaxID=71804 RepID=UPI0004F440D5|nr:calpain-like cysteine peptidase [Trypanosoma grayi]KEG10838.1 calpain-like cysteine peptidase [Trypanosoma grayi]